MYSTALRHYRISFLDPFCKPLYFHRDIISVLFNYYGRQPYYRNHPVVQKISLKPDQLGISNGRFHVDHLRQISLMLLVSDVTENDTHMEYCLKSNRRSLLREGIELTPAECELKAAEYSVVKCVGKKGTLFIFDTSGFHRANYVNNSTRKMLHFNVTSGHNIGKFIDKTLPFSEADNLPSYIKKMFRYCKG